MDEKGKPVTGSVVTPWLWVEYPVQDEEAYLPSLLLAMYSIETFWLMIDTFDFDINDI